MHLDDKIYGSVEVNEPVLVEIINSYELQRLKEISMAGYYPGCPEFNNPEYNRYNHSIGVLLLLRRYGASLSEQIAGLIHDVSHSAFSHTIDYIKKDQEGEKTHDGQDKVHESFVMNSGLREILERHGYDVAFILDDKNFPLKENDLPDVCADRLDYSVRQAYYDYHYLTFDEVKQIWNGLVVHNGSFVFSNLKAAELYTWSFYRQNELWWSGLPTAIMFSISAQMFRHALKQCYVTLDDFYHHGDAWVINKLKEYLQKDTKLAEYYQLLQRPATDFCNHSGEGENEDTIFCKSRIVNPYVLQADGSLHRYSELDADYSVKIANLPKFKQYSVRLRDNLEKMAG